MKERPIKIAVLFPSTGLIDGEICDMAEERGAEALIFKVSPRSVANAMDSAAVAQMTMEMGDPELLARVAMQTLDANPEVIVWACTSGSFLGATSRRNAQVDSMSIAAGGIPATTTSVAILDALRSKNTRHVVAITPYHHSIGRRFIDFLTQNGFEVDGEAHAGCGSDSDVGKLTFDDLAPLVRSAITSRTEALVIPCTALRKQNLVEDLSLTFGVQIVLANSATLDHAVKLARLSRALRDRN